MTKLITKGFTDYFGDVMPIDILGYDNNKYVKVKKPDGSVEEIKRGYIRADALMTKDISEVHWHVHGGGTRKSYRSHSRSTRYDAYLADDTRRNFPNKADALVYAKKQAARTGESVEIRQSVFGTRSSTVGNAYLECFSNGQVVQFSGRAKQGKYLRGYGKVSKGLRKVHERCSH